MLAYLHPHSHPLLLTMGTFDTFESNCTLPPEGINFVSSPSVRGTLDIVWSCLSILLLCTYSVLHLNVPVQSTPRTKKEGFRRTLFRTFDKLGWMLVNLAAPELPFAKAWSDYRSAKVAHEKLKQWAKLDGVDWSLTHTHVANMGGFVVKFRPCSSAAEKPATPSMWLEEVGITPPPPPSDSRSTEVDPASHRETATQAVQVPTVVPAQSQEAEMVPSSRQQPSVDLEEGSVELENLAVGPAPGCSTPHPVEQSAGSIPDRAIKVFDHLTGDEQWESIKDFQKSVQVWASRIGSIDWNVDEYNLELVKRALRSIKEYRFVTEEERKHFQLTWISWYRNLRTLQGDTWILDAHQLCLARKLGIIGSLPAVAEDDLDDRNKGDIPVLVVALFQILWFALQLIARLCQRKATSQLEIMAFSFAAVTAVTYALLWDKPKGMTSSMTVMADVHAQTPANVTRLALLGPSALFPKAFLVKALTRFHEPGISPHSALSRPLDSLSSGVLLVLLKYVRRLCIYIYLGLLRYWDSLPPGVLELLKYVDRLCISDFNIHIDHDLNRAKARASSTTYFLATCSLSLVCFGGLHLIAWDFVFPSPVERWLWLASSIATMAVPFYAIYYHQLSNTGWGRKLLDRQHILREMLLSLPISLTIVFVLARAFILVEVFRSLAFLPPGAFETSWPANLPHIG